ncbi:MAG: fasciclin domain-containing protein [Prevotella sp.]|nr:fasciclin domain-containing protein [Candidatus Prevotella equi]
MKYINKIGMMVVAGIALATASCSDYSDYNTAPLAEGNGAGQTLFENIKSNPNLQNFAAIVEKAGYANVLNSSQCYTLWAPADGTYDAEAILNGDSSTIVQRFVNQHLAQYNYPVSGTVDQNIVTVNTKHHIFTNSLFDQCPIKEINLPSSNGIMHIIDGNSPYYVSLYEHMDEIKGCNKFVDYIKSYADSVIDTHKSIKGPMVNGQQTYLDTVWRYFNPALSRVIEADIANEDSSFVMFYPTDKAWDNAHATIQNDFKYITNFHWADMTKDATLASSLKIGNITSDDVVKIDAALYNDSLPKYYMLHNLAYSLTDPYNQVLKDRNPQEGDSIRSVSGAKLSNIAEVLSYSSPYEEMSNGYAAILDSICFKSYQTYEPILKSTRPIRTLGLLSGTTYTVYDRPQKSLIPERDTLFSELPEFLKTFVLPKNSKLFQYLITDDKNFDGKSARTEMDFALATFNGRTGKYEKSVVATKYKAYVVFHPFSHDAEGASIIKKKPLYVRFDLAANDEKGAITFKRINVPGAEDVTDDIIIPANGRLNYVELDLEFPITYFGTDAFPTLCVSNAQSFATTSKRNNYEQELHIVGVYLVPQGAEEYVKTLKYKYEE